MSPLVAVLLLATAAAVERPWSTVNTFSGQLNYTEDWGYIDVSPRAHSFWWLYTTQSQDANRPLILWLQGGPGVGSTGYGNLEEIGPKDQDGKDRHGTWLQVADLVFVDCPIGAGFSYGEDNEGFVRNSKEAGIELFKWAQKFFAIHHEYIRRPFYIFSESYGGKFAAEFARQIYEQREVLDINFAGVALGDAWISPLDFVNSYAPYLHKKRLLNDVQLANANAHLKECLESVAKNEKVLKECETSTLDLVVNFAGGISAYNIRKSKGQDPWSKKRRRRSVTAEEDDGHTSNKTKNYMNHEMREKFGIIPDHVKFGAEIGLVKLYQKDDLMSNVYNIVDELLKSGVNVIVYNGDLDLKCNTLGAEKWINRLTWSGQVEYQKTEKKAFFTRPWTLGGFSKIYKNFQYYTIIAAGHMVSHDNPEASIWMLKNIMKHIVE